MIKGLLVLVLCLPLVEAKNHNNQTVNTTKDEETSTAEPGTRSPSNTYLRFDAIERLLNIYKAIYPEHVSVFSIGLSYEKRNILAIKFSTGNSPCKKESVIVEAGSHGREWLAIASTLRIIERMATKHGSDPEVNELINKYDWIFIPVLNPDGYEFSHTNDRLWRKNRHPFSNGCIGVDLNRNFNASWAGGNNKSCAPDYRGPVVNSEPETKALVDLFASSIHRPIIAFFSIHTYGQLIAVPYGYTTSKAPNDKLLRALAQSAADAIKKVDGRTFSVGNGIECVGYFFTGSSIDGALSQDVKFSYGFELRPNAIAGYGFQMPTTEIEPSYRELFAGLQAIMCGIMKLGS